MVASRVPTRNIVAKRLTVLTFPTMSSVVWSCPPASIQTLSRESAAGTATMMAQNA
jgi:hypothetical protein